MRRDKAVSSLRMAAMSVFEPIFKADIQREQHAYRAEHNALDAVRQVHRLVVSEHSEGVDPNLSGDFDSHRTTPRLYLKTRSGNEGRLRR
jgi:hypothetical protein